jgi:hypothetical protein
VVYVSIYISYNLKGNMIYMLRCIWSRFQSDMHGYVPVLVNAAKPYLNLVELC